MVLSTRFDAGVDHRHRVVAEQPDVHLRGRRQRPGALDGQGPAATPPVTRVATTVRVMSAPPRSRDRLAALHCCQRRRPAIVPPRHENVARGNARARSRVGSSDEHVVALRACERRLSARVLPCRHHAAPRRRRARVARSGGPGLRGHALQSRPLPDGQRHRRRGSRAGDVRAGPGRRGAVRARDEPQGLAVPHPPQYLPEPGPAPPEQSDGRRPRHGDARRSKRRAARRGCATTSSWTACASSWPRRSSAR